MHALRWMVDSWGALAVAVTWQLAALAVVAWLCEKLFRLRQPRARHALWWFVLVAPLLLAPGRMLLERRDAVVRVAAPQAVVRVVRLEAPGIERPRVAPPLVDTGTVARESAQPAASWWDGLPLTDAFAAVWLVGCVFLSLRLLVGHLRVRRMIAEGQPVGDAGALTVLAALLAAAGVRGEVGFRASAALGAPVLYGLRRPTILLPEGWVDWLSPDDLRALLAHEVAHVKRRDFLAQFLQRVVEIPLFFHPGAWLASRRIALAREELADAWALRNGADAVSYARSLSAAAERAQTGLSVASVGVAEGRSTLFRRVEAIMAREDVRRVRSFPAVALAGVLLTAAAAVSALGVGKEGVDATGGPETPPARDANAVPRSVEVLDVRFDPVASGKNTVSVRVRNLTDEPQVFAIGIQTKVHVDADSQRGWGTTFTVPLSPHGERASTFAYVFFDQPDAVSWVRLRFYDFHPVEDKRYDDYFQELTCVGSELAPRPPAPSPRPAAPGVTAAVTTSLRSMQEFLQREDYARAWDALTLSHRQAGFFDRFNSFTEKMDEAVPLVGWSRSDLIRLEPEAIALTGDTALLTARCGDATWTLQFVHSEGEWKIDWIDGYAERALLWQNWQERVLPTLEKRMTAYFNIYYETASTAERDIAAIARHKDRGYHEVAEFLGVDETPRIDLVLFEDEQTKWVETGHRGAGWAFGTTIVEVYNDNQRLDPYHETAHILARGLGSPPALFTEGLAVHMSERLGASPLEDLGGGDLTTYQRVRELHGSGDWIALGELITYTEIGSERSCPPIAYAEAGAFVRFLLDTYGKDRFLTAYQGLRNSDAPDVHAQNVEALEAIYGKSLEALEREWLAAGVASIREGG